jgi:hypothetical protein
MMIWPWKSKPIPDQREPIIIALERELDRHALERRVLVEDIVRSITNSEPDANGEPTPLPE